MVYLGDSNVERRLRRDEEVYALLEGPDMVKHIQFIRL
jgi:hypothetical protein